MNADLEALSERIRKFFERKNQIRDAANPSANDIVTNTERMVLRGGSWNTDDFFTRVSYRYFQPPDHGSYSYQPFYGFRCASAP